MLFKLDMLKRLCYLVTPSSKFIKDVYTAYILAFLSVNSRGKADFVEWTFPRQTGFFYYITISKVYMYAVNSRGKADFVEWTFPRQTGFFYYITISNKVYMYAVNSRGKADFVEWTFPRQTGFFYYITISNKNIYV